MKLNFKLLLPLSLFALIIIITFGYIFYHLSDSLAYVIMLLFFEIILALFLLFYVSKVYINNSNKTGERNIELELNHKENRVVVDDLNKEKKVLLQNKAIDEAILSSIGDGLVVIDKAGCITYSNKAFEEITGWTADEVLGKVLVEVIPSQTEKGEPIDNRTRFITKILAGEDPEYDLVTTVYYVRKDGSRFPVNSLVKRIILNGEMIGAVKTFRDVTEEKTIDKAKTEFVSLAAHQLRTPLSAIGWYTEMLLSGDAGEITEIQRKYLNQIYNGNMRMVNMVKSFLNVSRIDLGTMILENEPTSIPELLHIEIEEQKRNIKEKEINLSIDIEEDTRLINTDPERVRMVFQNLLSNAIKYTQNHGHIAITVAQSFADNEIQIKFSDDGMGIPVDAKSKIFSKLFRADNAVEKATKGTGLGLYIVKNIVENLGGRIWFESEENKGTTFFVTLPM